MIHVQTHVHDISHNTVRTMYDRAVQNGFKRQRWSAQWEIAQVNDPRQLFTHLVGVTVEIKVFQEAGGKLAEERVVGLVDGSQTPVSVVVGAGTCTESTH